jgi:hypothetical protein
MSQTNTLAYFTAAISDEEKHFVRLTTVVDFINTSHL